LRTWAYFINILFQIMCSSTL